jgi:hypothetical protein
MRSPFSFSKVLLAFIICVLCGMTAHAKPIKITVVSGLDFGNGGPGDIAKTIAPGTSETSSNASFEVSGDANTAYTITLPASGTMTTGNGQNTDTINLTNFQSFPTAGANGLLNVSGIQNLFLGATRAALKVTQRQGTYTGSYTMTVVY